MAFIQSIPVRGYTRKILYTRYLSPAGFTPKEDQAACHWFLFLFIQKQLRNTPRSGVLLTQKKKKVLSVLNPELKGSPFTVWGSRI